MNQKHTNLDEALTEGYHIEIGEVLDKSFNNYKKIVLIGAAAILITSIVIFAIYIAILGIVFGFTDFAKTISGLQPQLMTGTAKIIMLSVMMVISGIFAPIKAGFINMAHNAENNLPFGLNNIFEFYSSTHFKDLFVTEAIVVFISSGISFCLQTIGYPGISVFVSYTVMLFLVFTSPLIIYYDLKPFEAIAVSIKLVAKSPLKILLLLIVGFIFAFLGVFGLCIGIFFTVPFIISILYSTFNEIAPIVKADDLDEIGTL